MRENQIILSTEPNFRDKNKVVDIIPYKKDEDKIIVERCKLCQSEHREEMENWFDHNNSYRGLARWLQQTYHLEISVPAIRNHILYHYKILEKREALEGYAGDIQLWMEIEEDGLNMMRKRRAILERELVYLGSDCEDLSLTERRKNVETMKKIADTLLLYDEKIDGKKTKMEPVKYVFNQLNIIITDVMKKVKAQESKDILIEVLDRLQNSVESDREIEK